MKKWSTSKKENKLGFIVLVFSVLVCIISITYAIWTQVFKGEKEQVVTTGTLVLEFTNESNEISLTSAVPISDTKGLSLTPYTFTIKNTGTTSANYRISLVNDDDAYNADGCNSDSYKMKWSDIMYSFKSGENAATMNLLSENKGILSEGVLNSDSSINSSLRLWIKSDANNQVMGKHFHGKIKVEAIQSDRELNS